MQWKKSDKEERGIDQRHHLTPLSPVRVSLTLVLRNQWRAGQGDNSLTGRGPRVRGASIPSAAPSQLCTAGYVELPQQCTVRCIELQQARAASEGEYESAAAPCCKLPPVQKYKLQAATNTFQL